MIDVSPSSGQQPIHRRYSRARRAAKHWTRCPPQKRPAHHARVHGGASRSSSTWRPPRAVELAASVHARPWAPDAWRRRRRGARPGVDHGGGGARLAVDRVRVAGSPRAKSSAAPPSRAGDGAAASARHAWAARRRLDVVRARGARAEPSHGARARARRSPPRRAAPTSNPHVGVGAVRADGHAARGSGRRPSGSDDASGSSRPTSASSTPTGGRRLARIDDASRRRSRRTSPARRRGRGVADPALGVAAARL